MRWQKLSALGYSLILEPATQGNTRKVFIPCSIHVLPHRRGCAAPKSFPGMLYVPCVSSGSFVLPLKPQRDRPTQSPCPALEHHESCALREDIPCFTPGCVLCSIPAAAAAVGAIVHAGLAGRQLDQLVPLLLPLLLRVNQTRLKNGKENPKSSK